MFITIILVAISSIVITELAGRYILSFSLFTPSLSGYSEISNLIYPVKINALISLQLSYLFYAVIIITIVTALIVFRLSKYQITALLPGMTMKLRNIFLVVQFVTCFFFLTGGMIMYIRISKFEKQLYPSLSEKEKENIYVVNTFRSDGFNGETQEALRRFRELPFITDILLSQAPISISNQLPYYKDNNPYTHSFNSVSSNFLSFTGNGISEGYYNEGQNHIIADLISNKAKSHIKTGDINSTKKRDYTISCITSSVTIRSLFRYESDMNLFYPLQEEATPGLYLKFDPGYKGDKIKTINETLYQIFPETAIPKVYSFNEEIKYQTEFFEFLKTIMLTLGLISLIISLTGIFTSIDNDIRQRTKEIAIRKINGASYFDITMIFSKMYYKMVLLSLIIIFPILFICNEILRLTKSSAILNPILWISVSLFVLLFISLVMYIKIRHIVRLNPCLCLRSE